MANSVTVRTTAPGAKQAAGDVLGFQKALTGLGLSGAKSQAGLLGINKAMIGLGIGAIGAGVAIGAVTGFLKDGIESAIAEEQSLARLDTALEANVKGWDGNRDAIDAAIESRMALGFEDDALRDSMIKLVVATGNVTTSIEEQALAMDIARGRNIDLGAATDIVVKANMGNVGALRRLGIELKAGATKTEILAELQKRYGGQAVAYAETTAGSMEAAQVAIGEVAEDIGAMLIPVIKDAADWVRTDLIPAIDDIGKAWDGSVGAIQRWSDAEDDASSNSGIDEIAEATGKTREEVEALWAAQEEIAAQGPKLYGAALMGYASIYAGTMAAAEALGEWDQAAQDAFAVTRWTAYAAAWTGVGAAMVDNATEGATASSSNFVNTLEGIAEKAEKEAAGVFEDSAHGIGNSLADSLRSSKDDVGDAMDDLMYVINHPLKLEKEVARVEGELTSQALARGLASENPAIRNQAAQTQAYLRGQWTELTGIAWDEAHDASGNLKEGYADYYPGIKKDARDFIADMLAILNQRFKVAVTGNFKDDAEKGHEFSGGGRAGGGFVPEGQTVEVGERGRERVTAGRGGATVTPSGGFGQINVRVNLSTREFSDQSRHYAVVQQGAGAF